MSGRKQKTPQKGKENYLEYFVITLYHLSIDFTGVFGLYLCTGHLNLKKKTVKINGKVFF